MRTPELRTPEAPIADVRAPEVLIRIEALSTVFGPDPRGALTRVRAGCDKARLLAETGHTLALHDVNLEIARGEIFVIMGLSGSGKSTLVRHINRLIDPTEGRIWIDGEEVLGLPIPALIALRRHRLAMVFQRFGLHAHRRVVDNVAYGLEVQGMDPATRRARALEWVERVGLTGFESHYPAQLSGGMQQRVGLARALCAGTDIILMDEAFSALDPLIRSQLQAELLKLQDTLGKTIVFITHDLDEALRLGNRIAILRDGRLIQVGSPDDILLAPADAHVADFVRDVNRARALRVRNVLTAWPDGHAIPPPSQAVDADQSIESILPRLVGRTAALAVSRHGEVVGAVSLDKVRTLLGTADTP
ncbi:MAG: glycine betaine/L-proline ABC transporter ATP-binding protein [Rhodocyclaceae bacterium]